MNQDKYWKCEYENLRRKKNKEIEDLKVRMARGSNTFLQFLQETNQLERYYKWLKQQEGIEV